MADNFLEYQREAFEARKAKKERERKKRLRKYLEAYKKKLAQQKADQKESAEEWALTRDGRGKNPRVGICLRHVMGVKNPAGGVFLRFMPQIVDIHSRYWMKEPWGMAKKVGDLCRFSIEIVNFVSINSEL